MDRYVCPPWFECRCVLGKPVSKSTMLSHRRTANEKRAELGLPLFGWGPKVEPGIDLYVFDSLDSLIDHFSDTEEQSLLPMIAVVPENLSMQEGINVGIGFTANSPEACQSTYEQTTANETGYDESGAEPHDITGLVVQGLSVPQSVGYPHHRRANVPTPVSDEVDSSGHSSVNSDDRSDEGRRSGEGEGNDVDHPSVDIEQQVPVHIEVGQLQSVRFAELLPWLFENRRWVSLANKHALDETVMDEILVILNAPCKQWKTVISNVCRAAGLQDEVETYLMCPGHMAFVPDPESGLLPERCSECRCSAPTDGDPDCIYEYLPLIPRLRKTVASSQSSHELYSYRRVRESDPNTLRDYFDSESYRSLCARYGGEENLLDDIFLLASTDGFTPFKNRKYGIWTVAAINFNLPPEQRYLPQNVLQLSFIPGPRQPKNLQSFLLPLVNEMKEAAKGVLMRFPDGSFRSVRVHLICFTGDQPAICKVSGLVGPNGRTPCRDCKIQGCYYGHYYFPSKIKVSNRQTHVMFNPRNLPRRNVAEIEDAIELIQSASGGNKRDLQMNSGIRESSVLFSIPMILPYVSFPHDVMHTFYNVQVELLRIMLGSYQDDFSLHKSQVEELDAELKSWKWGIASQLGPQPMSLSKYKDWKAADHKTFSIFYSLVIFDGILSNLYLNGLRLLADLVDICRRGEVTSDDVEHVEKTAIKFYEHYERSYFKYREDRVDLCKSVFHILLHLSECMKNFGPLIGISQYWIEGHIGWIGGRNRSKNRPAQAMFKNAMFRESLNPFYNQGAFQKTSDIEVVAASGGYVMNGASKMLSFHTMPSRGRQIKGLIVDYLCRKYCLTESQSKEAVSNLTTVSFTPHLKFIVGSETQTSAAYLAVDGRHPKQTRNRPSCYVAVEMEEEDSSVDEVWYGRVLRLITFDLSFANNEPWATKHEVVMMDWARALCKGAQGQIYANGRMNSVFSGATIEDVSIIRRLVGIVEHSVPGPQASDNGRMPRRSHLRTYFLDNAILVDHLLSPRDNSLDGKNRVLRGFQR